MLKHVDPSYCGFIDETPKFSPALYLENLYFRNCRFFKRIHESITSLSKLVTLNLEGCETLEKLPINFFMLKSLEVLNLSGSKTLEEIPDLSASSNLKKLCLRECNRLRIIYDSTGPSLDKLVTLDLKGCENLKKLPSNSLVLNSLEFLNLSRCIDLEEIPDLSTASKLKELYLKESYRLRIIHDLLNSLEFLNLRMLPII
ncbi:disease resistance protein RPP4-like [Benincasa hispida]|uniref:disease resistance protein RPP4-like n=1 Tax=Benincasa hispida TaxID=102211 RepID=UPI0018FF2302|nr:disease resistance protein RPP4-like [Benincasa hispida]